MNAIDNVHSELWIQTHYHVCSNLREMQCGLHNLNPRLRIGGLLQSASPTHVKTTIRMFLYGVIDENKTQNTKQNVQHK